jgi:hypothetical protein
VKVKSSNHGQPAADDSQAGRIEILFDKPLLRALNVVCQENATRYGDSPRMCVGKMTLSGMCIVIYLYYVKK